LSEDEDLFGMITLLKLALCVNLDYVDFLVLMFFGILLFIIIVSLSFRIRLPLLSTLFERFMFFKIWVWSYVFNFL